MPVLCAAQARRADAQHQQAAREGQVCWGRPTDSIHEPRLRRAEPRLCLRGASKTQTSNGIRTIGWLRNPDDGKGAAVVQARAAWQVMTWQARLPEWRMSSHACASQNACDGERGGFDSTSMAASEQCAPGSTLPAPSPMPCQRHAVLCLPCRIWNGIAATFSSQCRCGKNAECAM